MNLQYHELLSNFTFKFYLRRYVGEDEKVQWPTVGNRYVAYRDTYASGRSGNVSGAAREKRPGETTTPQKVPEPQYVFTPLVTVFFSVLTLGIAAWSSTLAR